MEKIFKMVLIPQIVPIIDYCWNEDIICPHFDNNNNHITCAMNFTIIENEMGYVPKPEKCKKLKESK